MSAITNSGAFVLRAPLLPLSTLTDLLHGADMDEVTRRLGAIVEDPIVREALFVASPNLEERLDRWLRGEDTEAARTTRSLLSYVTRMATRCTPFGLFAGCAVGSAGGSETALDIGAPGDAVRHTRLDFEYLARVVADVQGDPAMRPSLRWVPNTSLYRAGGRLRMAEATYDGEILRYHRVAIEEDEFLSATLERAAEGASLSSLAAALVDEEIDLEEASEYVTELVDSQILVSDLGPAVTGPEPTAALADALSASPETGGLGGSLARAADAIAALDRDGVGQPADRFRAIAEDLGGPRIDRLFQVDLHLGARDLRVGDDVIAAAQRTVAVLHRLYQRPSETDVDRFVRAFQGRFEDAEIRLVEALDEEIGVGFGTSGASIDGRPLLAGPVPPRADTRPRRTAYDSALAEVLVEHGRRGGGTLVIDDAAVDRLAGDGTPPPLPDALAVHASLTESGLWWHGAYGPSGARLLGRFCHGDGAIDELVRRHLAAEEALNPDARFFEIVHLPEGRVGNVLCRPVLRSLEVAYLGRSGADPSQVLPATDILVSVGARGLVLRSQSLGVELIPRLSTAHNFRASRIALYRFLGALQSHGVADGLVWQWGALGGMASLPRVALSDGTVVSRAMWLLTSEELHALVRAKRIHDRVRALATLREARGLPRYVSVAMADNELLLDLDSVVAAELLAHEARGGGRVPMIEPVGAPDRLVARSPAGLHTNEVVIPFVRLPDPPKVGVPSSGRMAATTGHSDLGADTRRVFVPGSEWLSVKLYCGAGTADGIVRDVLAPLSRELLGSALADRWFFLRYGDPDWHLRARFHGDPEVLTAEVLPRVHDACAPLVDDGRLHAVVVDTYRREVERYGGPQGIELFEAWSSVDSTAVASLVAALAGDDGLDLRWRAAAAGIDGQLGVLGFDPPTRQRLVRRWRDGLVAEHGEGAQALLRHSGEVYRREKQDLAALLGGRVDHPVRPILDARDAGLAPIAAQLRVADLTRPLEEVAGSFTHLHVNRMLRGALRTQELVIYDLLDRWYRAAIARGGGEG